MNLPWLLGGGGGTFERGAWSVQGNLVSLPSEVGCICHGCLVGWGESAIVAY